jgi:hypothetical protein
MSGTGKGLECPYCGEAVDVMPKRSKKCRSCGRSMRVHEGKLVTVEVAQEERAIRNWLKGGRLGGFGVSRKDFDREREKLSRQFGFRAPVNDTVWRILNGLITPGRDYQEVRSAYWCMAWLAESEGKDPKLYERLAVEHGSRGFLLDLKVDDFWDRVKVVTKKDDEVCSGCRALEGRIFTVDEALSRLPIPGNCESE